MLSNTAEEKTKGVSREYRGDVRFDEWEKEMSGRQEPDQILPAFGRIDAAVCIVSSDEYAPFAGVVVQSLVANADENKNYDIVVLTDDMLISNRKRIENIANILPNVSVRVIDVSEMVKGLSFYTWAHFTPNTYYRLLTPDIFTNYEKVIYLDSDVVINHDIAELYATDLGDYMMAAAYDTHVVSYCMMGPLVRFDSTYDQVKYNTETLKMSDPTKYFQCGVSLYNIRQFHALPPRYLITEATKVDLMWLDQDLINMIFYGQIKEIPIKWNVMTANKLPNVDEYYLPDGLREEYYDAHCNPYIIHFVGKSMPCFSVKPDLYEYFWKYARMSIFYEVLLQRLSLDSAKKAMMPHVHALYGRINAVDEYTRSYTFRKLIKTICMPLFNLIFPYNSKRRKVLTHLYYKMRGGH